MKKRLISILLTLLMVMSLFTGMSVSAYADDDTDTLYVEYKLAAGDYVLRICQKLGINYYTCKEAIMALNNITSENGFRYLSVGEVVKIPVSDAAAIAIMTGNTSNSGSSTSGSTSGGTASGSNVSGATIAYYLIPYTMQRGETVLGVCNSLGISFANYADQIQKLNGISSWNKVNAGTTLLLPSPKTPAVGTTCYAVVAHKVASGDTAYTLSQKYGVNYGSSTKLLQALNNSDNLAAIKAGKNFYLPVATTITAASNNTGSSNNNSNTGSSVDKNNTNTGSTNTNAKSYDINANINTNYGTMAFYVNNASVNSAKEGDVVTVNVTTKDGRAVESIVVKYNDGRADVKLEANSFIMPACDVRVDANIKSGNDITINSNYSFKTVAQVGGINVSSAAAGSSVKIVSTDPGFEVKEIEAYYSTLLGLKKEIISVNEQNCFVMPNKDVVINVTLAPVTTYNFYRGDTKNGNFDVQVDGNSVSKAAKGAQVTVLWQAMSGYEISALTVEKYDAKTGKTTGNVSVYNNSFTMPASDILITVSFDSTVNSIDLEAVEGGRLRAIVGGVAGASEAATEANVVIVGEGNANAGYQNTIKELVVTRKADGHRVTTTKNSDGSYSFQMPAGGVIVSGKLDSISTNKVAVFFNATGSENRVTMKADGYNNWSVIDNESGATNEYAVGTYITLSALARDSHAFTNYKVYVGANKVFDQELTDMANEQGLLIMPNSDLVVEAYFSADEIAIGPANVIGSGTVSYQVDKGNGFEAANSCKVGDTVKIIAKYPFSGAISTKDTIEVINKATGKPLQLTDDLTFQMPAEGVSITVNFVGKDHVLQLKVVDVNNKDLGAESLMGVSINDTETIVVNKAGGITLNVKSGDTLNFVQTAVGKNKYVIDNVVFEGINSGDPHEGGLEYNLGEFQVAMWDEDAIITIVMEEIGENTYSLDNIGWVRERGSVGSTTDLINKTIESSCEAGDYVFVIARPVDSYFVEEDSINIVRNFDEGKFTKGEVIKNVNNISKATLIDGQYYPVKDGGETVVGWMYKMPEGGALVYVDFKSGKNPITLNVSCDGKTTDANSNKLNDMGYVVITSTDSNTLYEVSQGKTQDIGYGQAVKVALSTTGAERYTIKSVNVTGKDSKSVIEVNNNGFWMPAEEVTVDVVLEAKNSAPVTVNLPTASGEYGSLQYFAEEACNSNLNSTVEAGKDVFIRPSLKTGYKVTGISVKYGSSELATKTGTDGVWKFIAPEGSINVTVTYEKIVSTLTVTVNYAADVNKLAVKIGNNAEQVISTSGQTSFEVEYGQSIKFYGVNKNTLEKMTIDGNDYTGSTVSITMPEKDIAVTSFTMK